jgi:hypothetical protein
LAARVASWFGPKGCKIGVGFDDEHFAWAEMESEIDAMRQAHPNLPDEVPPGTTFVFLKEGTGHISARFRVGDTVYRSAAERSLRRLWETVYLIEQLAHPARYRSVS